MTTVRRAIYLLLSPVLGTLWFSWFVTVFATGLALAITLLGLPVLALGLWSIRGAAHAERRLLHRFLDLELTAGYRRPQRPGWWPTFQARATDPQTWRDFGYLFGQMPLGLATLPIVIAVGWIPWIGPRVIGALAGLQAKWARAMLASSPDPELTAQVTESRSAQARIIEAADAERRRLERDLHDGAQQRLVSLSLKLAMAKAKLGDDGEARALLDEAHAESKAAVAELRDLARGIHPAILTDRGLGPALEELASRATVPTDVLGVPEERLPARVEATAYFVVAEALANVAKYAEATHAGVRVDHQDDRLVLEIRDDGVGGADPTAGSGLRGLADRVGALDGRLEVDSAPGWGTRIRAELPLSAVRTSG